MGVDYGSRVAFSKSKDGNDRVRAMASTNVRGRRPGAAAKVVFDDIEREPAGE